MDLPLTSSLRTLRCQWILCRVFRGPVTEGRGRPSSYIRRHYSGDGPVRTRTVHETTSKVFEVEVGGTTIVELCRDPSTPFPPDTHSRGSLPGSSPTRKIIRRTPCDATQDSGRTPTVISLSELTSSHFYRRSSLIEK